jgi:hypothetical protein
MLDSKLGKKLRKKKFCADNGVEVYEEFGEVSIS